MKQSHWKLPSTLLRESIAVMQPHGARGNEGLALWLGTDHGDHSRVTHVVDVAGPGFITTPLYMSLSLRAMAALTELAERFNTFLVGQIHSHPQRLLDLSDLDKQQGIRCQGYLSVVCPHYAQRQVTGFDECGVHVFENQHYRRMPGDEILRRLIVCDTPITRIHCEVPA